MATTLVLIAVYTMGGLRVGIPSPSEPAPASATAKEAVRGFLEALIAGDATAALSYAATAPADPRMLTDDVLAESLATNPMGDIQVLESTGSSNHESVQVLYRVSDRQVKATIDAVRLGEKWLLQSVSTKAHLSRINARALGLQLNGVALPTDTPELFIGTYTLTTSDYRLAITGSTFFVESFRTNPNTAEISVDLSDEGLGAIRDSAHSKLTACLQEKKLAPSRCGFSATTTAGNPQPEHDQLASHKRRKGAEVDEGVPGQRRPDDSPRQGQHQAEHHILHHRRLGPTSRHSRLRGLREPPDPLN